MFKAQSDQELDQWEGPCISCKYSLAFGNRLTYLAAMSVLGIEEGVTYSPGWGDQLTFELHQENGQWFVKIFNNQIQVKLNSQDGNIPLDEFREYVCSRMYFGDLDAVAAGAEDYHQMANLKGGSCTSIAKVVPLFGCKKKSNYQESENSHPELGWTRDELNNNEKIDRFGKGRMHQSVMYLGQSSSSGSSGSSYSYESSSPDGGSAPQDGSSYSYSYSYGDDGSSSGSQGDAGSSGSSYSYSSSSEDSSSQEAAAPASGSSYSYSSQSSEAAPAAPASSSYSSWNVEPSSQSSSYSDPTVARFAPVNNNYMSQSAIQNQYVALETRSSGFKEVARTEVEIPVIVKKPVTTYIDEEVCRTVTIPTYRKDYSLFRYFFKPFYTL
jgi:hypothetical protein